MSDSGVRVVNEGGIDAYLAAADDPLVAALREYHSYFHDGLWQKKQPSPLPIVLYMNAYQLFLAAARMALSGHLTFPLRGAHSEGECFGWCHSWVTVGDRKRPGGIRRRPQGLSLSF